MVLKKWEGQENALSISQIYLFFRQVEAAKEIISESLPIKCLEAVILGLYPFNTSLFKQLVCS